MDHEEEIAFLWDEYDNASAELVKAKRRLREGIATESAVRMLQLKLLAFRLDLTARGESVDPAEPGDVPLLMPST